MLLECVVNVSEGRNEHLLAELDGVCGPSLLDRHTDPDHHRSVFTLAGPPAATERAARDLTRSAVDRVDLRHHRGAHPRFGVVDVVPFVGFDQPGAPGGPLRPLAADHPEVTGARDRFGAWAGQELALPAFAYGPSVGTGAGAARTLPEVRRGAFQALRPDWGPSTPHPSAGAIAVGARGALVAYNLWLGAGRVASARAIASAIREPGLRALGLLVGTRVQVSCNLVDPFTLGPSVVYDRVAARAAELGDEVIGAELVGLLPAAVLRAVPEGRWAQLDLAEGSTIEARLEDASLRRR